MADAAPAPGPTPGAPAPRSAYATGVAERTRHSRANAVTVDTRIRCTGDLNGRICNKLLAEMAGRPWLLRCPRCKAVNESPPVPYDTTVVVALRDEAPG